jgi:hypothetical protein
MAVNASDEKMLAVGGGIGSEKNRGRADGRDFSCVDFNQGEL